MQTLMPPGHLTDRGIMATSGLQLRQLHCGRQRKEGENNLSCDQFVSLWSSKALTYKGERRHCLCWGRGVLNKKK